MQLFRRSSHRRTVREHGSRCNRPKLHPLKYRLVYRLTHPKVIGVDNNLHEHLHEQP